MLYLNNEGDKVFIINLKCCFSTFETMTKENKTRKITKKYMNDRIDTNVVSGWKKVLMLDPYIIVRNPYKKLYSFYYDKFVVNINNPPYDNQLSQITMQNYVPIEKLKEHKFTFDDFLETIKKGYKDDHIIPQSILYKYYKFKKPVTILKVEDNFDERLSELLNLKRSDISHSNSHTYELELTENQKRFIYETYKDDFINFGYDKEF